MDTKPIADFLMGDEITGFFYLSRIDLKSRRDRQGQYVSLDLADASGQILGHVWDHADAVARELTAGDIVKVKGSVQSYQGRKQLSISRIRKATADDEIDMENLIPSVGEKAETLWREYSRLAGDVVNPFLRSLLRKFIDDETFRIAFCKAPASSGTHHCYIGGLLEHSVSVARDCERLSQQHTGVDRDLVLAAALLHDIGKSRAYETGPRFEFTEEGRLLGSAALGVQLLLQKCQEIAAFPPELVARLQHLMMCVYDAEVGTENMPPKTAEALLLYHVDRLDSLLNLYFHMKKRVQRDQAKWNPQVPRVEYQFYFGEK